MARRDLRSMKNQRAKNSNNVNDDEKKATGKDVNVDNIEDAKEIISKYEDKSESEMMQDLMSMSQKGREDGSLNDEMLKGFYKNVEPMLDGDQKKKLNSIMDMLKK